MAQALVGIGSSLLASEPGKRLVNAALDSVGSIGSSLIQKFEGMITGNDKKKKSENDYNMQIQKMYEQGTKQLNQVYNTIDGINKNLKRAFDRLDIIEEGLEYSNSRRKKQRINF